MFLLPVARGIAQIKCRTRQILQALRFVCEGLRLAQGLLESYIWSVRQSDFPTVGDLSELRNKISEWNHLLKSYEEQSREIEALSSLASILYWQCALTWPTRLMQRLFVTWFGDQHRLDRLVTCRRDRIGRFLGTHKEAFCKAQSSVPARKPDQDKRRLPRHASLPPTTYLENVAPRRSRTLSMILQIPRLHLVELQTPLSPGALSFSSSFTSASPLSACSATALSAARERVRETPHSTPPHGRDVLGQRPNQKRRNPRDVQLQWSYFTHAFLLSHIFEKYADVQAPGQLDMRSPQDTLSHDWASFNSGSGELLSRLPLVVDSCDCCCNIADNSTHCDEAARLVRNHLALSCAAPVPPIKSSILQSLFVRRKNCDALKEVARALAHLQDETCEAPIIQSSPVVQVAEEFKDSLERLVTAHANKIKEASELSCRLMQPSADDDLIDAASSMIEGLLGLSSEIVAEEPAVVEEPDNEPAVPDWLQRWQHTCVVMSQWKVLLASFYDTQMFQSDLEGGSSERRASIREGG